METYPPNYLLVHPLPAAPNFVGREKELHELRSLLQEGFRGVVSLVGLGGAGKTAVAERFLKDLTSADTSGRPEGLFLWSFYQEPDAGLFFQKAYNYFAEPHAGQPPAKGAGLLHQFREVLNKAGINWLVLDGLEKVQCQNSVQSESFGTIEDPLLKSLLTRIAEGMGQTVALVTSRFPLTDLHPFLGCGYRTLEVGGLNQEAAIALLRKRGVRGDDVALGRLIENHGAHALTLDHLGGLIGQFLNGDPNRAPEAVEIVNPGKDRQALRLARLLMVYEKHLPATELALLCRLCLLRRSVTEEHVRQFFLCLPQVHARTVRELELLIQRYPELEKHLGKDLVLDLAKSICSTLEDAQCSEVIAGPEEAFRSEICAVADKVLEVHKTTMEMEFGELARLYADPALETPTDSLPLDGPDRKALRSWHTHYSHLSEHPLLPYQEPPTSLENAFENLGFGKKPSPQMAAEIGHADVMEGLRRAKDGLRYLAVKHFALRRVRELCRIYQRKWSLAGPLADLDAAAIQQILTTLVERHLVLREADNSFSVHPAVRDYFHGLAKNLDQVAWHDILREHLLSLVQRPGKRHPEDSATLDLAEEALYHALEAGRINEALWLYNEVFGGLRQLAWKLGETNRGLRILRCFHPCPEPWDLAWYLRAFGEFNQAFACNELPYFRADILILQGRLPRVAEIGDSTRTPIAQFLMGKTTDLPPDQMGSTFPRAQFLLYLGELNRVFRSSDRGVFYGDIGWEGDRARLFLFFAEAARRQADPAACRRYLDSASTWILHSGSAEHLCLFHLTRARYLRPGNPESAQLAVVEGLHVARQCSLGLYLIELLSEQAEIFMVRGDFTAAEQTAREALQRASAPDCQFMWGAAQAGHLLGQSLTSQKDFRAARDILLQTRELRHRIGDPGVAATEKFLESLPK
jgi:hypothetical protein